MFDRLHVVAAAVAAVLVSVPAVASAAVRDSVPATSAPSAQESAGPRMDKATTAFRVASRTVDTLSVPLQRRRGDVSKPVAIMLVGGAAIILGSTVVDGDAGDLVVIGGVVALLYGLYQYLK